MPIARVDSETGRENENAFRSKLLFPKRDLLGVFHRRRYLDMTPRDLRAAYQGMG